MWGDADTSDALENATELITAAAEFDQRAGGGNFELDLVGEPREDADAESEPGAERLAEWLHQISLVSDVDAIDEEQGAVTLMTLHAAKGLEFDTVFVVGVEDDLLPHERSKDDSMGIEEERRLFFVAMTRAQRSLTITSAKWRATRGVSRRSTRSPFLRELPADQIELLQVGAEGQAESMDEADDSAGLGIDFGDWRAGQFVHSDEYGVGKLLWVQSRSKQTYAGVAFEHHGEKTLVLEYADLQRVEPDEIG
jgi:DNA helicase-2/ATP-dependent DNA helicase PcrA